MQRLWGWLGYFHLSTRYFYFLFFLSVNSRTQGVLRLEGTLSAFRPVHKVEEDGGETLAKAAKLTNAGVRGLEVTWLEGVSFPGVTFDLCWELLTFWPPALLQKAQVPYKFTALSLTWEV